MEYLMTYGWAILIIAVVLGALFQLGVFNSSSFSPRAPPGACQVFRPGGPGTTTNINMMGVCTGQLPQYVAQFNRQFSYVDAGNTAALNALPITISSWFKTSRSDSNVGLITKYTGGSGEGYNLDLNAGKLQGWYLSNAYANGHSTFAVDSPLINDGVWHFAALTVAPSGLTLYLDGVAKTTVAWGGSFVPTTTGLNLWLGRYDVAGSFNGTFANVQIYNTSLSANQVQALYLEGIGGAPMKLQNLVGWWPLNGNSNDYSGNNNNGVPTNVVFTSQYGK